MTTSASKPPVGDEAIRRRSGKGWDEWVTILDAWGGEERTHTEIAAHVHEAYGVDGTWAQSVAVGYERLTGRRAVGQVAGGTFVGRASKTLPVPLDRLFAAWVDEAERDRWLPPGMLTLRIAQEGRSARFDLASGGILGLWFSDKGAKSVVQLEQEKLPSKEAADAFRVAWKAHLAALVASLES